MDRYDQEVARLTANPDLIFESWQNVEPLFAFARDPLQNYNTGIGCPTMIARGVAVAATPELTEIIRAMNLPIDPDDITVDDLPRFAECQRIVDRTLNRTPPPLLPDPVS